MQTIYLAFNIGDSMFDDGSDVLLVRRNISETEFLGYLGRGDLVSCLNRSHRNTIKEMERRFRVGLPVPDNPPRVTLAQGDSLLTISTRGLPRKGNNVVEYRPADLEGASFHFSLWTVLESGNAAKGVDRS